MSRSRKRMVLMMFQSQMSYFPTMREIRDELINAQIEMIQLESCSWNINKSHFKYLADHYKQNWQLLFDLANLGNLDKPLTRKVLSDPCNPIVRHILYLYTMECFIYEEINRAIRTKDKSKIKYYGAYAAALSFIIHFANSNTKSTLKLDKSTKLYRGVKMSQEIADNFVVGECVNLLGYTSTSLQKETAIYFAFKNNHSPAQNNSSCSPQIPIVFEILFHGNKGLLQLPSDCSAFPSEQEILV